MGSRLLMSYAYINEMMAGMVLKSGVKNASTHVNYVLKRLHSVPSVRKIVI